MAKYYEEELKSLKEGFWAYQYFIDYWCNEENKYKCCSGIVLAVSLEAAIDQVRNYYIEDEDEISELYVKEMPYGELTSNLVFEINDAEVNK